MNRYVYFGYTMKQAVINSATIRKAPNRDGISSNGWEVPIIDLPIEPPRVSGTFKPIWFISKYAKKPTEDPSRQTKPIHHCHRCKTREGLRRSSPIKKDSRIARKSAPTPSIFRLYRSNSPS